MYANILLLARRSQVSTWETMAAYIWMIYQPRCLVGPSKQRIGVNVGYLIFGP